MVRGTKSRLRTLPQIVADAVEGVGRIVEIPEDIKELVCQHLLHSPGLGGYYMKFAMKCFCMSLDTNGLHSSMWALSWINTCGAGILQ